MKIEILGYYIELTFRLAVVFCSLRVKLEDEEPIIVSTTRRVPGWMLRHPDQVLEGIVYGLLPELEQDKKKKVTLWECMAFNPVTTINKIVINIGKVQS